jgi:quinoprotein glucose dehydrogenase
MPTKPAPFARQLFTEDMLTNRTPEAHAWAEEQFKTFRSEGQFVPLSVGKDTVVFPGFDGGAEWGGSASDPQGILYVNANDLPWTGAMADNMTAGSSPTRILYLSNCAACHQDNMQGSGDFPSLIGVATRHTPEEIANFIHNGKGRMPPFASLTDDQITLLAAFVTSGGTGRPAAAAGAAARGRGGNASGPPPPPPAPDDAAAQPYRFTGYKRFYDPDGYPAVVPPWGTLNAINLNTGEYVWKIPLGEYPALVAQGVKDTGSENYGGPIVTAGGLVFISATNFDKKIRAFDKDTGKLRWEATLPFAGNSTPATYMINGRQYLVIDATGSEDRRNRATARSVYVAFALPQ